MDAIQVLVLALLQGLTEFLPISSSAHLILVPTMTGWPDQGLAFDVAVHVGTLVAVLVYFRREIAAIARDFARSVARGGFEGEGRLAWYVGVATIPVGLAGLVVNRYAGDALRAPLVIAGANVLFALLLLWSDRAGARRREVGALRMRDAVLVGLAQVLALVPGTSRSGVTMTMALALGFTRAAAARFSFLLAVPVIGLAGGLKTLDLLQSTDPVPWGAILTGTALSGVCAYAVIHAFLAWVERAGMLPFVVYRLVLGVVLAAVFV